MRERGPAYPDGPLIPIDDEAVHAAVRVVCARILAVPANERQRALQAVLDILRTTVELATHLEDVSDPTPH